MSSPISRIGSQRPVGRDDGSDGHAQVSNRLDQKPHPRNAKVDEVAKMYERQFLGEMFKAMRSTVNETEKPSMAQNIFNSQRDEQYLDAWSEKGGIGFSNIIYDQIMERFFGQTAQGQALKKQGPVALTDRDISNVSKVEHGVAKQIVPAAPVAAVASASSAVRSVQSPAAAVSDSVPVQKSESVLPIKTFENTEPMPAPTPPRVNDIRSTSERVEAGELFPATATTKPKTENRAETVSATETAADNSVPRQTALQIEVRPSPTGSPAKIQAPWDATVIQSTRLDGSRTAVTLEHGPGVRSTLVFDGVLGAGVKAGEKIPRGQTVGTLNADAKSFLWNLATTGQD